MEKKIMALIKTMNKIIGKKVANWLETINDKALRELITENIVITGGCFPSMIQNETPKDFDCYFKTKDATKRVAEYYVNQWNDAHKDKRNKQGKACQVFVLDGAEPSEELLEYYHISAINQAKSRMIANTPPERLKIIFPSDGVVGDPQEVRANEELGDALSNITEIDETKADEIIEREKRKYFPVFLSTNAITLSNGIQIVVRFYGEPDKIHETYDFQHTKAYWTNETGTVIPNEVYDAVINKTLIYTGSKYPVCSIFRMRKFIERGWKINAGQMLKICMQVSELDLMDIDTLEDQLVGVDSLYFMELIEQFRRMKEKNVDFDLTPQYIISVIDKIF
jgi:hypothetical protein